MDLKINFDNVCGKIKRLHGVNNGPVSYGSTVDVSHYFKKAGIPSVRLHDSNWPHPREVDIHTIFPDFSKDPNDPESYDFSRTDEYLRSIIDTGAKIIYRLGESIEHTQQKYYVHPPRDFKKWAQICLGIIRHYNHGWANGFYNNIEYWEVWNEPDNRAGNISPMWSGTSKQYFELYNIASTAIKKFDPKLKVGGFGATMSHKDFIQDFLEYCRKNKLPLDFFSWHTYTSDPQKIMINSKYVHDQLFRNGFRETESHLNEWNFFESDFKKLWLQGSEYIRQDTFEKAKSTVGASFSASVLMMLQESSVQSSNYFDGQPSAKFCGLFNYYGVPQKTFYAFEAFQHLCQFPLRIDTAVDNSINGIYCCGGKNEQDEVAILISNFRGQGRLYSIKMENFIDDSNRVCQKYMLDDNYDLELVHTCKASQIKDDMEIFIPTNSTVLLKIVNKN
ncbi:GH39 family glycosyl hydrolase [Virgibacillus dakarensis]|uniref:GH39 family glycosyl hydrolase n=1 Tax=Virgibacillus dakarensis TaxID=1917889 RepID=UPI00135671E2|nr:hypothetical protein [Virgibacillus dakarensis]